MGKEAVADAFKADYADRLTAATNRMKGLLAKLKSLKNQCHTDILLFVRTSENTGFRESFGDIHVFGNLEKPQLLEFISDFTKQVDEPHVRIYKDNEPFGGFTKSSIKTENTGAITSNMLTLKKKVYSTKFTAYLNDGENEIPVDPHLWHSKEKKTQSELIPPIKRYGTSEYLVRDATGNIWLLPTGSRMISYPSLKNEGGFIDELESMGVKENPQEHKDELVTLQVQKKISTKGAITEPKFRRIIKASKTDYFNLSDSNDTVPIELRDQHSSMSNCHAIVETKIPKKRRVNQESTKKVTVKTENDYKSNISDPNCYASELLQDVAFNYDDFNKLKLCNGLAIFDITGDEILSQGVVPAQTHVTEILSHGVVPAQTHVTKIQYNHNQDNHITHNTYNIPNQPFFTPMQFDDDQELCAVSHTIDLVPVKEESPDVPLIVESNKCITKAVKSSACLQRLQKQNELLRAIAKRQKVPGRLEENPAELLKSCIKIQ